MTEEERLRLRDAEREASRLRALVRTLCHEVIWRRRENALLETALTYQARLRSNLQQGFYGDHPPTDIGLPTLEQLFPEI